MIFLAKLTMFGSRTFALLAMGLQIWTSDPPFKRLSPANDQASKSSASDGLSIQGRM